MTKDDYGSYTCRAKNSAGVDEAKMLLNVLIRPRIYEFLNITRAENTDAEIVCKATGRPPPMITFRFVFLFSFLFFYFCEQNVIQS